MTWATPERRLRLTWELFLVSFLALYLELVAIRWLASEVRVFAYFKNLPLMAAFMLVEVKSIAELSLLFGSTWLVNSAAFSGILLMILAANAVVARRAEVNRGATYTWLGASLIVPYLVGLGWLNAGPFAWRAAIGALATSLPIFFAGMIFATSFRRVRDASGVLAANMFGALVGGILEYSSMAWGIRSLTLLALGLYGLSWLAQAFRG